MDDSSCRRNGDIGKLGKRSLRPRDDEHPAFLRWPRQVGSHNMMA